MHIVSRGKRLSVYGHLAYPECRILETLHSVLSGHVVYYYSIRSVSQLAVLRSFSSQDWLESNYNNPLALLVPTWTVIVCPRAFLTHNDLLLTVEQIQVLVGVSISRDSVSGVLI